MSEVFSDSGNQAQEELDDTATATQDWDDPANVDYHFLLKGRAKPPGVLVTHGGIFKFHKSGGNRAETIWWWSCGDKKTTGCLARASTSVSEDGTHVLMSVSHPDVSPH